MKHSMASHIGRETVRARLRERSGPSNLVPDSKSFAAELAVIGGGEQVTSWSEVGSDDSLHLDETLRVLHRLEAPHAPLALPRRLMRVLGPVVHIPMLPVSHAGHHHPFRGRIAISNNRFLDIDNDQVRFQWRDYRHHDRVKTMALSADEFIRRFLIHVLPGGFQRIRYYGFLGSRGRQEKLALCRRLLGMPPTVPPPTAERDYRDRVEDLAGCSLRRLGCASAN
jgi:hypothetical protein